MTDGVILVGGEALYDLVLQRAKAKRQSENNRVARVVRRALLQSKKRAKRGEHTCSAENVGSRELLRQHRERHEAEERVGANLPRDAAENRMTRPLRQFENADEQILERREHREKRHEVHGVKDLNFY